jgi:prepilin-type processing-associated H-X9-DG protein
MPSLLVGASVARLSQCHSEYTDLEGVRQRTNVPLLIEEDTEYWVGYGYPDGSWGSSDSFSGRHFNGCNIGYLDGHVEHRQMPPGMNAYDLYLHTPKGSSITFGRHGFRWASGLDDWYVDQ